MRKCDACGKENDDALTECESCNTPLPGTHGLAESDGGDYDNTPRKEYPCYKESMLKKIGGFALGFLAFAFIGWLSVGGWIHSFSKHGVGWGVASVFVPPIGWYRSIEFFWHNDFAGVDWPKRLEYDGQSCINLIVFSCETDDGKKAAYSTQVTGAIEEFSKQISKYPKDKRQYLEELSKNYILYMEAFYTDAQIFYNNKKTEYKKSESTIKYEKELFKYPFIKEEIDAIKLIMPKDIPADRWDNITDEEFAKGKEVFELISRSIKRNLRSAYKNIFNEELHE